MAGSDDEWVFVDCDDEKASPEAASAVPAPAVCASDNATEVVTAVAAADIESKSGGEVDERGSNTYGDNTDEGDSSSDDEDAYSDYSNEGRLERGHESDEDLDQVHDEPDQAQAAFEERKPLDKLRGRRLLEMRLAAGNAYGGSSYRDDRDALMELLYRGYGAGGKSDYGYGGDGGYCINSNHYGGGGGGLSDYDYGSGRDDGGLSDFDYGSGRGYYGGLLDFDYGSGRGYYYKFTIASLTSTTAAVGAITARRRGYYSRISHFDYGSGRGHHGGISGYRPAGYFGNQYYPRRGRPYYVRSLSSVGMYGYAHTRYPPFSYPWE